MNNEIWKPIVGCGDFYEVSSLGRVRSIDRYVPTKLGGKQLKSGKILSQGLNSWGYFHVVLCYNGFRKSKRVNRLVALTFIDNKDNYLQVNHINEIKTDNRLSNLEWITAKENSNHGTRNKRIGLSLRNSSLSKPVVQTTLNDEIIKEWVSMWEAKRSGYCNVCIGRCCSGKSKTHKGYKWKFAETKES